MFKKILMIVTMIVLLATLVIAYNFYQTNNLNGFVRSERKLGISEFERDDEIKYSEARSYKIESEVYNDAMIFKTVDVQKNTPYKVTCMVKTKNVESEIFSSGVGAQISIEGTNERSIAVSGTEEWQKIELIVNSKDREELNIGFRLGGYLGEVKGTAWFSDFTIEEGIVGTENNTWNFGCFIFPTTDVEIEGEDIEISMSRNEMIDISDTLERFQNSTGQLSEYKMEVEYDLHHMTEPLSTLSYDETFGYFVAPEDVESQIEEIVKANNYDHIFVIIKLR